MNITPTPMLALAPYPHMLTLWHNASSEKKNCPALHTFENRKPKTETPHERGGRPRPPTPPLESSGDDGGGGRGGGGLKMAILAV